jgi:hypothetical protein
MDEDDWKERALKAEDFLRRRGFNPCDIAACNCGLWHGGHANERLNEIQNALEDHGYSTEGRTILDTLQEALKTHDR